MLSLQFICKSSCVSLSYKLILLGATKSVNVLSLSTGLVDHAGDGQIDDLRKARFFIEKRIEQLMNQVD